MLHIKRVLGSIPRKHEPQEPAKLGTPWGDALDTSAILQEHPRPQFARTSFALLNGVWEYAIVPDGGTPAGSPGGSSESCLSDLPANPPAEFDGDILVPFSPESALSGVGRQVGPADTLWYRRTFFLEGSCTATARAADSDAGRHANVADSDVALDLPAGSKLLLHFEAVDHACTCWVNGIAVGGHVGGYLPFCFDITAAVRPGANEILLRVTDPSDTGVQLRGKQRLVPGNIWYTAQSGIWQPVWLEVVPQLHIARADIAADLDAGTVRIEAEVVGLPPTGQADGGNDGDTSDNGNGDLVRTSGRPSGQVAGQAAEQVAGQVAGQPSGQSAVPPLTVEVLDDAGTVVATGQAAPAGASADGPQTVVLAVADPHPWSPEDPYLYGLRLVCGEDVVVSYCAFRRVTVEVVRGDAADKTNGTGEAGIPRFTLNHRPYFLRGVLDQGYWSDGLMTAPSDEALIADIAAMRAAGFNMLRKHIKIERDRWYYHCDRLGMLVWQDMVCGGGPLEPWSSSFKPTLFRASWSRYDDSTPAHQGHLSAGDTRYRELWLEGCRGTIAHLRNHPCIVTWVLFNEGWGQFDARGAVRLVRALDPTRPIDATSGWYDQGCGDYWSVHNYFRDLEVYPDPSRGDRGGRLAADGQDRDGGRDSRALGRAFVISEAGGLTFHVNHHSSLESSYGYAAYEDLDAWRTAVRGLLGQLDDLERGGLAGFVYTQLSDVEEETNGLLTYDRRVNKLIDATPPTAPTPMAPPTVPTAPASPTAADDGGNR